MFILKLIQEHHIHRNNDFAVDPITVTAELVFCRAKSGKYDVITIFLSTYISFNLWYLLTKTSPNLINFLCKTSTAVLKF